MQVADDALGPIDELGAWWDVVAVTPVLVDTRHHFLVEARRPATHLRLDVHPDGGLTRLRCFGELPDEVRRGLYEQFWAVLPDEHRQFLGTMPVPPGEAAPTDEA